MLIFSGSSHPALANEVAHCLGIKVGSMHLEHFPDGETSIRIEESVRGKDVFVLQSIALNPNQYLMELLIIIDALKRASARSVTAVIPYFGYCRQDRKDKPREPITAKLVANMLTRAGADRILTMDLHSGQVEGFFDIPVDHVHAIPLLADKFKEFCSEEFVIVAPDIGSIKLTHAYAHYLNADFVVIDKERHSATEVAVVTIIGEVKGKNVLLADDMCSTGGTLVSAAKACHEKGAKRIFAAVSHGILVGDAVEKIEKSPIEALLLSNTVQYTERLARAKKLNYVSVAPSLSQVIRCITSNKAISDK